MALHLFACAGRKRRRDDQLVSNQAAPQPYWVQKKDMVKCGGASLAPFVNLPIVRHVRDMFGSCQMRKMQKSNDTVLSHMLSKAPYMSDEALAKALGVSCDYLISRSRRVGGFERIASKGTRTSIFDGLVMAKMRPA